MLDFRVAMDPGYDAEVLDIGRTTSVQVVDQWKFGRSSGRDGSAGEIERVQSGKAANDISERVEARKVDSLIVKEPMWRLPRLREDRYTGNGQ